MNTFDPLSPENRAAPAELIGDTAHPAGPDFLLRLGHTIKDCRTHDHGTGEDLFCGNLFGWMGERMALVVRRLLDAEAELEKYVGKEPTVAEEMAYLSSCLDAVRAVCDKTRHNARRWEQPLPEPEWVAAVEQAANGERPGGPSDSRRRLYLDDEGAAWVDGIVTSDGTQWIGYVHPSGGQETPEMVRARTGALREIGRTR